MKPWRMRMPAGITMLSCKTRRPRCEQTGFWDSLYYPEYNGYGYRQAEREFSLSIPPRTTDGTEAVLPLEDIGLPEANLFVRIQIDPYSATRSSTKRKRS